MSNPVVYIPQEPRKRDEDGEWKPLYDLSPALRFGTLKMLLPHGPLLLDTSTVMKSLREKLKDFCDNDYIMLIGDPAAIASTIMVASDINDGLVNVLRYDRAEKRYNVVVFEL